MPRDSITRDELKDQVLNSLNHSEAPLSVEQLCKLHPVAPLRVRRALRALNSDGLIDYVKKGRYRFASPARELPELTDKEINVFSSIIHDDDNFPGMSARSFSGRVSSLIKKGILERADGGALTLTDLGEVMRSKAV